jgi:hypothetical protein
MVPHDILPDYPPRAKTAPESRHSALVVKPDAQLALLADARLHDPYACLGIRQNGNVWRVRAFNPHARAAAVATAAGWVALSQGAVAGLFEAQLDTPPDSPCRLRFEEGGTKL